MAKSVTVTLKEDEARRIAEALEADRDSYLESADDARKEGDRASAESFREAAKRISEVLARLQAELGD